MRALTGLKQAGLAVQKNDVAGRLPEIAINKIHVDPNNARRAEDESSPAGLEEQSELTQDIKKRGVKSPVSLRPHPTMDSEYILNYGHRRVKGAIEAGLSTIPYFIDVNFDSYDQVKENLLHRKPSIWALAEFIQRRLGEGQSKGEIAEGLGKTNQNLVTELQALVDAPACLHRAYANGVRSARTLYDLRRAYDEYPEETEVWCSTTETITRETIRAFVLHTHEAAADKTPAHIPTNNISQSEPASASPAPSEKLRTEQAEVTPRAAATDSAATGGLLAVAAAGDSTQQPVQPSPGLRHDVKTRKEPDQHHAPLAIAAMPTVIRWTMVEHLGRAARIAPNATVKIQLVDDDSILEVPVADLTFSKFQ